MSETFNKLFKKRGFHETLLALFSAKNYSLSLTEFIDKISEFGSYYNAFFRVREELIKYGLITLKKNRYGDKSISLTEKGIRVCRILKRIDFLLNSTYEKYKNQLKKLNKQKKARLRRIQREKKIEEKETTP